MEGRLVRERIAGLNKLQLVAINPPGLADPSVAIAASRAGGVGILNLELVVDPQRAQAAIGALVRFGRPTLGVMLDSTATEFVEQVLAELPEQVAVVVLTSADPEVLRRHVATLRGQDRQIWLEVTDIAEARLGEQLGVNGLIAKGHEAGGWVGNETTFILLQRLRAQTTLPVWARGGIGAHTAAACYAAGAAGVVLDYQLALTHESALPDAAKQAIAAMDGSETICLGVELGRSVRVYARPGSPALEHARGFAAARGAETRPRADVQAEWRSDVTARMGWDSFETSLWPVSQDAGFAAALAERYVTVGGVLHAIDAAVDHHIRAAQRLQPLGEDAALARSHGIRYPIAQGPMTRVSDRAEFALSVAEGGGLPFLALALMRAPEVEALLDETRQSLGDRPWGVGILGFVPAELRQEQMDVICRYRPPVALIAGGRPDQAHFLEQQGIPTYLHVPSPGLLRLFLQDGSRRFVFEGRECGGHVGPRSSFVLWNTMVDVLLDEVGAGDAADVHVLFAGGIHDAQSAAMVAALAAPLAERGMHVGALMGTAYVFTQEAVAAGAIVGGFQEEALRCQQTELIESGPGHSVRCAPTAFVNLFEQEKQRLLRAGRPHDEVRQALEDLNVGRLRVASKGITRHPRYGHDPAAPKYVAIDEAEQHEQGMYMLGQVAALHAQVFTIADLHHDVAVGGVERLHELPAPDSAEEAAASRPSDVAIVGMATLLPKAPDLLTYWHNILDKVDAVTEVPADRWDADRYYDSDRTARDKIYSKWGGFLDDVAFDPMRYGIPPNTLRSIEPIQLLTLDVVRAALEDSGYLQRPFPRERTAVILGAGGGIGDVGQQYTMRATLPEVLEDVPQQILDQLPEWTEDSFPGILLNVISGRVANRFDLGGVNYTVDAACASSLAAVYQGVRELEMGTSDVVITGGVDNVQNSFAFLAFSKTHALSPRGRCRTFDDSADGIAIAEGVAVVVLKRLADAERDGDRIYAVIKGIAGSSDGRDKSLTAPRPEGQARAVERAYAKAGFSPTTVGLVEAHGTGTVVGDQAEVETLKRVFEPAGAARQSCAIGSVKSMVGHTKAAAGVAGMVKVALALHHKVLPATLGVEKPNTKIGFEDSPFYVNSEGRPWIEGVSSHPRRAGVSAFGFGGTNFHAVLEEYTGGFMEQQAPRQRWPSELLLWSAPSRETLAAGLHSLGEALDQGAQPRLPDLAYTLYKSFVKVEAPDNICLAIVAASLDDLRSKLNGAAAQLAAATTAEIADPKGIYFSAQPLARDGKIAFLFPGQGSQSVNMLLDLAVAFPEVRETFERMDRVLAGRFEGPLSGYVFPPPAFDAEAQQRQQEALTRTNVAQPALGAAAIALFGLLRSLGVWPEMVAGHSYGEYAALCAAGAIDEAALATLSEARGRSIVEAARDDLGTMAAVQATPDEIEPAIAGIEQVWLANLNAPRQTMISGSRVGIAAAVERLKTLGIAARPIPVACAFHSPIVAPARERLAHALNKTAFAGPRIEVFSNTTAAPYPAEPVAMAALLAEHLVRPVRFTDEVEAMYAAGARLFVEVGPRSVVTGLVRQILDGRSFAALHLDQPGKPGLTQLQHALGQLAAHGAPIKLERLFRGRAVRLLNLHRLVEDTAPKPLAPTTWFVNGGRARPRHEPAGRPQLRAKLQAVREPMPANGHVMEPAAAAAQAVVQGASNGHAASAVSNGYSAPVASNGNGSHQATPPAPPTPAGQVGLMSAGAGAVMGQFQNLMGRFLETQRNVMLTYLAGTEAAAAPIMSSAPVVTPALQPPPVVEQGNGAARITPVEPAYAAPVNGTVAAPPAEIIAPALPEPPAEKNGAANGHLTREHVTGSLLEIVSERTGYPIDMLDVDQDLEASLGIDSIKRVEILGRLRQTLPADSAPDMDRLSRLRTLREIVDSLDVSATASPAAGDGARNGKVSVKPTAPAPAAPARSAPAPVVQRWMLRAEERPLSAPAKKLMPGGVVIITDDALGIADALGVWLEREGHPVAVLRAPIEGVARDPLRCDLRSAAEVEDALLHIRQTRGPIAALLHLLPLRPGPLFEHMDLRTWRERLALETRSLFLLAKALRGDLERAEAAGGAAMIAATGMGGAFGSVLTEETGSIFPGQGALAGLLKTLAKELPIARVKAVDLEPMEAASKLAEYLLAELTAGDQIGEVGYRQGRRVTLAAAHAPVGDQARLELDSQSVVLLTGGAQGITADVALELAEQGRPTLILAGRTPLPADELPDTVGIAGPHALKAALIERFRKQGRTVTPVEIEKEYGRTLKEREIRRNLRALREAGAEVHYYAVDVRDEVAFGALIDDIYRAFGRLDGVVHGAGVIEDKLVQDKSLESFDRVFGTKTDSAFILSRHLRMESLRFLVFFSSVAGRFGNRGQSDYAAANEVLNKLAIYLDRRWPARVVSINWGPWAKLGMVSPELEREFGRRGVVMIPPELGRDRFSEELRYGRKGDAEVIIGGNQL